MFVTFLKFRFLFRTPHYWHYTTIVTQNEGKRFKGKYDGRYKPWFFWFRWGRWRFCATR